MTNEIDKIKERQRIFIGLAIFAGTIATLLVILGMIGVVGITAAILCSLSAVLLSALCYCGVKELQKEIDEDEIE